MTLPYRAPNGGYYAYKKAPAKPGPLNHWQPPIKSARIEFDDQMRLHLHRKRHVGQSGDAGELRRHLGVIDFEEVGHVALGKLDRFQNRGELPGGFLDLDHIADLHLEARDVDAAAVHLDVAVVDELPRREHRRHELGAIDDRVETALQQSHHVGAGVALEAAGLLVDAAELPLGNVAVIAAQLLLGLELH